MVYNQSLGECRRHYEKTGSMYSQYDLVKMVKLMKNEDTELRNGYSACMQESIHRVYKAFNGFFRRINSGENPGCPRFKKIGRFHSFTYTQNDQFSVLGINRLRLGKIGAVYFKGSIQRYYEMGVPKICTVKRAPTGKWYANVVYEFEFIKFGCETFSRKTEVGVDLNIRNLATLSDGTVYNNSKLVEKNQISIQKLQKKISKNDDDPIKKEKYKKHLNHIFERLNNKRRDEAHKISRELVDNHTFLAFEDLNIQGMIDDISAQCENKKQVSNIHKAQYSVAWRRLLTYTKYKAEDADVTLVVVNPAHTSQMCSRCKNIKPKTLDERMHYCKKCGLIMSRDRNAAINILNKARGADLHLEYGENYSSRGELDP